MLSFLTTLSLFHTSTELDTSSVVALYDSLDDSLRIVPCEFGVPVVEIPMLYRILLAIYRSFQDFETFLQYQDDFLERVLCTHRVPSGTIPIPYSILLILGIPKRYC